MHRHAARLRTIVLLSSALVLAACADAPTASRALAPGTDERDVVTDGPNAAVASLSGMDRVNVNIPTQFHAQNPCAGGRFGEIVVFTGNQHLVARRRTWICTRRCTSRSTPTATSAPG